MRTQVYRSGAKAFTPPSGFVELLDSGLWRGHRYAENISVRQFLNQDTAERWVRGLAHLPMDAKIEREARL